MPFLGVRLGALRRRCFAALLPLLQACAISSGPNLPATDASTDVPFTSYNDFDHDGICDATEDSLGTDPLQADSDGDSFPDDVERAFGSNPLVPAEPNRDDIVYLSESATAPLSVTPVLRVRGMGQVFTGFATAGAGARTGGVLATELVESAYAVDAYPRANVFEIDAANQRFVGVEGTTRLIFDLRLYAGNQEPRDCRRAFIVRYYAKTLEGNVYSGPTYYVIVTPDVNSARYAEWCEQTVCI